jgi:hypothetical protein
MQGDIDNLWPWFSRMGNYWLMSSRQSAPSQDAMGLLRAFRSHHLKAHSIRHFSSRGNDITGDRNCVCGFSLEWAELPQRAHRILWWRSIRPLIVDPANACVNHTRTTMTPWSTSILWVRRIKYQAVKVSLFEVLSIQVDERCLHGCLFTWFRITMQESHVSCRSWIRPWYNNDAHGFSDDSVVLR